MNPPRLISDQHNQEKVALSGGAPVIRLRPHHRGSAPLQNRDLKTDGSSALAATFVTPAPRHLHAVGSKGEQEWVVQLTARITGAVIEVLAGARPVHQLAHLMHRDILAALQLRVRLSSKDVPGAAPKLAVIHRSATILSSRASMVRPGVYETSAVVSERLRCRAVALRLEQVQDNGWRVTALEIG